MSENTAVTYDHTGAHGAPEPSRGAKASPFPIAPDRLGASLEALLLSLDRPISSTKLSAALGLSRDTEETEAKPRKRGKDEAGSEGPAIVDRTVEELNSSYAESGRTFRIERVAGGYRLMTLPEFASVLAAFHRSRSGNRLGKAAVETLSIIAYKQPITRAHLEAIRGVGCGEILRSLLERRLVTIKGRAEELGRPILYGTTKEFLDVFGLASLKDLPTATELQGMP
jgi:segregation and condensation protein B